MMNREKLGLQHKDILFTALKSAGTNLSEYSFANLYLFRNVHDYHVISDHETWIEGLTRKGQRYIMPTRDIREIEASYLRDILTEYENMYPIPEEWLTAFSGEEYLFSYSNDDSDYIHHIEKMGSYAGKKMHKKKNLLTQFLALYTHQALPLTEKEMDDARRILDLWQKEMTVAPEDTDYYSTREALTLYDELILCGGIYYADNEPAGFIIGEELNEKVFALHFAKGLRRYKGIYQFMYNNFANIMPKKYCCFNFEQDMGNEALRQAKESYYPEEMVKKYNVALKK